MSLTFSPDAKIGILLRDFDQCMMQGAPGCRRRADRDPNHRLNRGAGGSSLDIVNDTANGCGICSSCNIGIEAIPELAEEARRRGVKLVAGGSSETIITTTPMWHPAYRQWVLLDRAGLHLTGVLDESLDARRADEWLPGRDDTLMGDIVSGGQANAPGTSTGAFRPNTPSFADRRGEPSS